MKTMNYTQQHAVLTSRHALKSLALILSCLMFSPELLAQAPAGTVISDNRSNVYLVVEFHTYSCASDCSPDDYAFYGSQYDFPDNQLGVTHTFAQDPCGTPLDAQDIMAITFTEFTGGGGAVASWTMSFCDLDNLDTYGAKTETYWSPSFGVFIDVQVTYDSMNQRIVVTTT